MFSGLLTFPLELKHTEPKRDYSDIWKITRNERSHSPWSPLDLLPSPSNPRKALHRVSILLFLVWTWVGTHLLTWKKKMVDAKTLLRWLVSEWKWSQKETPVFTLGEPRKHYLFGSRDLKKGHLECRMGKYLLSDLSVWLGYLIWERFREEKSWRMRVSTGRDWPR